MQQLYRAVCSVHDAECPVLLSEEWATQGWGYLTPEGLVKYTAWLREHEGCAKRLDEAAVE